MPNNPEKSTANAEAQQKLKAILLIGGAAMRSEAETHKLYTELRSLGRYEGIIWNVLFEAPETHVLVMPQTPGESILIDQIYEDGGTFRLDPASAGYRDSLTTLWGDITCFPGSTLKIDERDDTIWLFSGDGKKRALHDASTDVQLLSQAELSSQYQSS